MNNQVIKEPVNCETAEQFMSVLSPVGKYFGTSTLDDNWLFRGQGQNYRLIPSLLRLDAFSREKIQKLTKYPVEDYSQLIRAELDFLIKFFEIADKQGLILPDDSQDFRSSIEKLKQYVKDDDYKIDQDTWVTLTKVLSVMALAQHYGIPTRLLDWTRKPYVAAFFAAEDAYTHKYAPSSLLVVWAFYFPVFGEQRRWKDDRWGIQGVTAPSATNTNLKAQQGVFTLMDFEFAQEGKGGCLSFDEALEKSIESIRTRSTSDNKYLQSLLQKFTLPVSEAEKLLFLLAKIDITPSSIYPGYGSIVSDLQMRRSFDQL